MPSVIYTPLYFRGIFFVGLAGEPLNVSILISFMILLLAP